MKKYLAVGLALSFLIVPAITSAALTSSQISSIVMLLQAFDANPSVVSNVQTILTHAGSSSTMADTTSLSTKFTIGQSVIESIDQCDVRSVASENTTDTIGQQSQGTIGTITDGPTAADGVGGNLTWWKVNFASGPSGWVNETCLSANPNSPTQSPTITLIPNTSAYKSGNTITVSWTANTTAAGTSFYYEGAQGQTSTLITTGTGTSGSFQWTVPSTISGSWRIRGTNTTDGDFFSSTFTVTSQTTTTGTSSITVLSPNGGEQLSAGKTYQVTWNSANLGSDSVNVVLAYDANQISGISSGCIEQGVQAVVGTNGKYILSNCSGLSDGTSNTGSFNWTVPSTLPSGSAYYVCVDQLRQNGAFDCSNAPFTITGNTTTAAPAISSLSTYSVAAGNQITVYGSNFDQGSYVQIDGRVGYIVNPTQITSGYFYVSIPSNVPVGAHVIQVCSSNANLPCSQPPVTFTVTSQTTSATNTVSGTPAFHSGSTTFNPTITQATCGTTYTFSVDGYSGSQVWLTQQKLALGAGSWTQSYNGPITVPWVITSKCGQDEGSYSNAVYTIVNGQAGTPIGSPVLFAINQNAASTPTGSISSISITGLDSASQSGSLPAGVTGNGNFSFTAMANTGEPTLHYHIDWATCASQDYDATVTNGAVVPIKGFTFGNCSYGGLPGTYTIAFTASSIVNPSISKTVTKTITLSSNPVGINYMTITPPANVSAGATLPYVFSAGGLSLSDQTLNYKVDWGDGSAVIQDSGPNDNTSPYAGDGINKTYSHKYASSGSYTITFTATSPSNTSIYRTITSTVAVAPSSAAFNFSANGAALVAGQNSWTFSLTNANPGDVLSANAYKNGTLIGSPTICTVAGGATSCNQTGTPQSTDVGSWTENVFINGVQKGTISFTVTAPTTTTTAPAPTSNGTVCSLSFSETNIKVGDTVSWTVASNSAGITGYWYGMKNGVIDQSGTLPAISQSYTYQSSDIGSYTRWVVFKDGSGNTVCTTDPVNLNVSVSGTADATNSSEMASIFTALQKAIDLLQ